MSDREDNVYKAKLAEQAKRYDEMFEAMKKVASLEVELTPEEHDLLAIACRKVTKPKRTSLRIISSIEQEEESNGAEDKLVLIRQYRTQVERELKEICSDILGVLDTRRIPCASTDAFRVFYYKMKGDYHRYLAEFATGTDRKLAVENSLVAYEKANDIAVNGLPPTNSIRLALAVNLSVFYYEFLNSVEEACRIALAAFDDAMAELNTMRSDERHKFPKLSILGLLVDNVAVWKLDMQGEETEGGHVETNEELDDVER